MKILLCCGAGMSSGFLANNLKKAAKKNKVSAEVMAKSHVEVENYLSDADILLIGPHYEGEKQKFNKMVEQYNIPMLVIPKTIYGMLDGEGLLKFVLEELNK